MTIRKQSEFDGLRAAGLVVAAALDAMEAAVRPGITTAELDAIAGQVLRARGARSAPRLVYGFPAETCISVDDEVVHGIPGARRLRSGDVVKLDVTVERDGFMADAARTVVVDDRSELGLRLAACARRAFRAGLAAARPGNRVGAIGARVDAVVRRDRFRVVPELAGHGIGRTIHEPPSVPNVGPPGAGVVLREGDVLTIEPILCAGSGAVHVAADGWTFRTDDGSLAAHFEHTLVVSRQGPILLTAA